jgi:hypothetical protein
MEKYQQHLTETQRCLYKFETWMQNDDPRERMFTYQAIGGTKFKEIADGLQKLNVVLNAESAKERMVQLNEEIKESLGMVKFIHQTMKGLQPTATGQSDIGAKLQHIENLIDSINAKRYVETSDKLYLEIETGQTWKILSDIFSVFIKLKEDVDRIARSDETYDKISTDITINVKKVLEVLETFISTVTKLLTSLNDAVYMIRKSVYDVYSLDDIAFVPDGVKIDLEQYKTQTTFESKFEELMVGYDGIITDATAGILGNAFNKLQLDKIKSDYLDKLNGIRDNIKPLISKTYAGIHGMHGVQSGGNKTTNGVYQVGGNEETIKNLYSFNIELQKAQKLLNDVLSKWKEYQHNYVRFNNYFMYNIYCLTVPTSNKIQINYVYADTNTLKEYSDVLSRIIIDFNNFTQISNEKEKKIISYFNVYHYYTIKKLQKFFEFVLPEVGNKVIDIRRCKGDVYHNFVLFNQFKDILDVYVEMNKK